jgi:hypothetical protein
LNIFDEDDFEKKLDAEKERNKVYLNEFEKSLRDDGMAEKTIRRHMKNAEFFIDEYLCFYESRHMEEGCEEMTSYFGSFYIYKYPSTPGTIKTAAASLKKFYRAMFTNGHVSKEAYENLASDIKYDMDEWMELCKQYNDSEQ